MANINIRLGKNFTTQYNKLQEEYYAELANINGFDDDQLSYTDFIDNFIDKDTGKKWQDLMDVPMNN